MIIFECEMTGEQEQESISGLPDGWVAYTDEDGIDHEFNSMESCRDWLDVMIQAKTDEESGVVAG